VSWRPAEYSARVWSVQSHELIGEVTVNGAALAVAFAGDSQTVAVGDSAGNLFFGRPEASSVLRSARAPQAVQAVAFSPDGALIASGDAGGNLQLWNTATAAPVGAAHVFRYPVFSVHFDASGRHLFVRSGHWLHRLALDDDGLALLESRLVEAGLETDTMTGGPDDGRYLRLVNGTGPGFATEYGESLQSVSGPEPRVAADQLERDWQGILALALDPDTGSVELPR
jgi:hypothetical protein